MLTRRLAVAAVPFTKKVLSLNAPAVGILAHRLSHDGPPPGYKYPHMDEIPVPCGSWQENYDNYQRKYNIHLLMGVGIFSITCVAGYYSGLFDLYLWLPDKPLPRELMNLNR